LERLELEILATDPTDPASWRWRYEID